MEKGTHFFEHIPLIYGRYDMPRLWIAVADRSRLRLYRKVHNENIEMIAQAEAGAGRDADFMRELAAWLDGAEKERGFDRLVLVAPHDVLAALRETLSDNVNDRVIAEVDKDMNALNDHDLRAHLTNILWF